MEQANETTTAVSVLDDYSVIVADKERLLAFFTDPKSLDGLYDGIEKMAKGLVADPLTKEGASQIKGCAKQIASVKIKVDNIGKQVKADVNRLPTLIDDNRRVFVRKMEALQDEIRRPVTEIEEREDEIARISQIQQHLMEAGSDTIRQNIEFVKAIPLTSEKWKESLEKATKAVNGEINALETMLKAAEKREAEARELEELRKKQEEAERIIREQKIREEAERKAREEAEARAAAEKACLEREKQEAERKAAEAERAAQEAREREEADRNSKEALERAAIGAQQAVPMSKTLPQPKPSKWTEEQKAVNKRIVADIADIIEPELKTRIAGHSDPGYRLAAEESAKAVMKAVLTGKINNLNVEY
jgi:DNA repair exonuclease SbcCD ATPase subunit